MAIQLVAITGNTYPVKDQLKSLGARWNPEAKAWMVEPSKADQARAIVTGRAPSADASTGVSRPASDKQRRAIGKLLRRVEHIRRFDSFPGSGEQLADEIWGQIGTWGGLDSLSLTSKQASQLLDQLIGAVEDEM